MGLTRAALVAELPRALAGYRWSASDNGAAVDLDGQPLILELGAESERRIGALALPSVQLALHFHGHPAERVDAFMQTFDRRLQRGGG